MNLNERRSVFLADDDDDDCFLFQKALSEISLSTQLTTVHDGEQLMQLLTTLTGELPYALFLDLNMPRKNGFECLAEIKQNEKLKPLIVVIFSTSFQQHVADQLYENGAQYYIRKPSDFKELKEIIHHTLSIIEKNRFTGSIQPAKENFVLA